MIITIQLLSGSAATFTQPDLDSGIQIAECLDSGSSKKYSRYSAQSLGKKEGCK